MRERNPFGYWKGWCRMVDEYIRRADALYAIQRQRGATRSPAQNRLLDLIVVDIVRAPAADVVEAVRCKDCKHGELYERNDGETGVYCNCSNSIFKYANENTFTPVRDVDDFCSYGLRKRRYNALPDLREVDNEKDEKHE